MTMEITFHLSLPWTLYYQGKHVSVDKVEEPDFLFAGCGEGREYFMKKVTVNRIFKVVFQGVLSPACWLELVS